MRFLIIRRLIVALVAAAHIAALTPPLWAAETGSLRAGAAKVDITPKELTGLYSVWATRFTGVHDPICARALVVDDGANTAALVALDLVEYGDSTPVRERIHRELGIPVDHIMIAASHDHNAPRGGPITPGTSSAEGRPYSTPAYTQFVDDRILQSVKEAKAALQAARVGIGSGRADVNVNRNGFNGKGYGGADPEGPSDKTVWVVKFESLAGAPIALLMNYAVHSVVAGPNVTEVTGDLAGAAERIVERQYDDKVVALWTMGPAGDQNPKYNVGMPGSAKAKNPGQDSELAYEAMNAQAFIVASEAVQTANRIQQMTPAARIQAAESMFSCATTPPRPRPVNAGPSPFVPNPDFKEVIPAPVAMNIHLNLIEINHIAITGVSGEVFTRIYWHLRKDSPLADTIMVTMSNDRIGYIGDDAAYSGQISNPAVVRGCAEAGIVNGLVKLMEEHP